MMKSLGMVLIGAARHEVQVIADDGSPLRTFDIRDITKESGLKFLGRRVDMTG
jgi:hypothetical protein